ncbi:uncharacterized protein LOC130718390 [Lotus japonicus]|uniref:uncharacterized protein LOC130718390 n=1 Tax=Lotus japonicus TaxID=34305 RepID=UPI00258DE468|nr:uncharacterized protein LOC130718390 [Lotus japonicus]
MIKRFPNRNPRSKGIKVKHILQIVLLLGICFWLIYQVKHNRGRKKEFDENDAKLSVRTHQTDQIVKLGRKDLHPGKDELNQNEKHEEDEEDEHVVEDEENKHEHDEQEEEGIRLETEESKDDKHEGREQEEEENKHGAEVLEEENQHEHDEHEQEEERNQHETEESKDNNHEGGEQEEEENKHGAEELKEDDNKSEEMEDAGKGGGGGDDDEIDENDQEKPEVDMDRDDGKDKEEEGDAKENEDSEDEEKGGSAENHGNHMAREEHYKGDDASSAVAHDTHATSTENETFSMENSDLNIETNITKPENETAYSDESNQNRNDSNLNVIEGEGVDRISSNASSDKETGNDNLFNSVDISYLNKTFKTSSNLIEDDANTSISSEHNKTVDTTMITGDIKNLQTEGSQQSGNGISEENLPDTDSTVAVKTENGGPAARESSNQRDGESEKVIGFVASNETENSSSNLDRNESSGTTESDESNGSNESNESQNTDATEDETFKGDTSMGGTDETSGSFSADEILDSVEHDAIDSFDTHIQDHRDVSEVRTDLDTLPDIRNEGYNGDETAAE